MHIDWICNTKIREEKCLDLTLRQIQKRNKWLAFLNLSKTFNWKIVCKRFLSSQILWNACYKHTCYLGCSDNKLYFLQLFPFPLEDLKLYYFCFHIHKHGSVEKVHLFCIRLTLHSAESVEKVANKHGPPSSVSNALTRWVRCDELFIFSSSEQLTGISVIDCELWALSWGVVFFKFS